MTLIWAYGQSGNEFYAEDELKYHSGRNRGRFTFRIIQTRNVAFLKLLLM